VGNSSTSFALLGVLDLPEDDVEEIQIFEAILIAKIDYVVSVVRKFYGVNDLGDITQYDGCI